MELSKEGSILVYLHLPIVCSGCHRQVGLLAQWGRSQLLQRWVLCKEDAVCMAFAVPWLCPACSHSRSYLGNIGIHIPVRWKLQDAHAAVIMTMNQDCQ